MSEQAASNAHEDEAAMDKDKQQVNTQADSGFLSAGNLITTQSSIDLENEEQTDEDLEVAPEPKKASESGLDFGLTDSLNQLSLKEEIVMDSGSIHPDTENHCEENTNIKESPCEKTEDKRVPWEVYYSSDDEGDTQLHIAIAHEMEEAIFFLIAIAPHPCLLNILNDHCQSALHYAVLTHQPRIARRLILAGADPDVRDFEGNTPLHLACISGDLSCARALCDPVTPDEQSLLGADKQLSLLPQNLELRNYNGQCCIHIVASKGNIELIRLLARLGADLEAREGLDGNTALHVAIVKRQRELALTMLRECKFNVDVRNYAGETAHRFAQRCREKQVAQELARLDAIVEPYLESDSESESDDEENDSEGYIITLARLGITRKPVVATA